jgi:hypothetical protein
VLLTEEEVEEEETLLDELAVPPGIMNWDGSRTKVSTRLQKQRTNALTCRNGT